MNGEKIGTICMAAMFVVPPILFSWMWTIYWTKRRAKKKELYTNKEVLVKDQKVEEPEEETEDLFKNWKVEY